jgi:hypothetical protein
VLKAQAVADHLSPTPALIPRNTTLPGELSLSELPPPEKPLGLGGVGMAGCCWLGLWTGRKLIDGFPFFSVCKEPPYKVEESGYAGFIMPIEVHFRNKVRASSCSGQDAQPSGGPDRGRWRQFTESRDQSPVPGACL